MTDLDQGWTSHPEVRARVNARVSGDPHCWPTQWFRRKLATRLPLRNSLSIGCGTGSLERDLVRQRITFRITGIDAAESSLEIAREEARKARLNAITYVQADAREYLEAHQGFDSIFFHASLRRFERPSDLLLRVRRALTPSGLLYLDEYVGPSTREWGPRQLFLPNLFYYLLPKSLRRPRLIRAPAGPEDPEDPGEAVRASGILEAVGEHFRILERRDYGGNLVSLLYPNLRRPGTGPGAPSRKEFDQAVRFLLDREELLMKHPRVTGGRSFYTVVVAEPKA